MLTCEKRWTGVRGGAWRGRGGGGGGGEVAELVTCYRKSTSHKNTTPSPSSEHSLVLFLVFSVGVFSWFRSCSCSCSSLRASKIVFIINPMSVMKYYPIIPQHLPSSFHFLILKKSALALANDGKAGHQ